MCLSAFVLISAAAFSMDKNPADELTPEQKEKLAELQESADLLLLKVEDLKIERKAAETKAERKAIRKEIKAVKSELEALDAEAQAVGGGIYIGGGALIVILLLILLL